MPQLKRILLVDDEPDILTISRLSLEKVGGWQVDTASSGAQALAQLDVAAPDAVLLDMMMPGMDGLATLRAIHDRDPKPTYPVIFMTAKTQQSEIEEFLAAGALGVIPKPFDPMQLPALLQSIVDTRS